ncbi:hypothetical protein MKEN_00350600 [Mycena kentingensis (nom. inval.)]|nr:hypothetical protein MKEN_00350600 [Mycena kentingensis (nom. inval.)]
MLSRAARRCSPGNTLRRQISYASKVRAFPFKFSMEDAIQKVAMTNALSGSHVDVKAAFLEFLNQKSEIRPERIVPIYYPAWLIDAEVEVKGTLKSLRDKDPEAAEGTLSATFVNSYLPGHTMDKLSMTCLLTDFPSVESAVPFSSDLEEQFDTRITCLPFQTNPLPLLENATRLPPDLLDLDAASFLPSTIRANLMCAYPILLPLYLAQYKFLDIYKTIVIEAHSDDARILVERVKLSESIDKEALDSSKDVLVPPSSAVEAVLRYIEERTEDAPGKFSKYFWYANGAPTNDTNISTVVVPASWALGKREDSDQLHFNLSPISKLLTPESLQSLVTSDNSIMSDPRIRPFTEDEVRAVRIYFDLGDERARAYSAVQGIMAVKDGEATPKGTADKAKLETYAADVDKSRENAVPSWWKQANSHPKAKKK